MAQILLHRQSTAIEVEEILGGTISIQEEILQGNRLVICTARRSTCRLIDDGGCDVANFRVVVSRIGEFRRQVQSIIPRARVRNRICQLTGVIRNLRGIKKQTDHTGIFNHDVMCDIPMAQIGKRVGPAHDTCCCIRVRKVGVGHRTQELEAPRLS